MWAIFKCEFYSRSYRCMCEDMKRASWKMIWLSLIIFALCPTLAIIVICMMDEILPRVGCGIYLFLTLIISRVFICPPIKRAIAEMKAANRQEDQEAASISLQTLNPQAPPAEEGEQSNPVSMISSWFVIPHRRPVDDGAQDDLLQRVREHNARYSHPVFDHPIAETSFIQAREDDEEGAAAPHVTHRSRHPSSLTDEPPSSSTLSDTTVEGLGPPTGDDN